MEETVWQAKKKDRDASDQSSADDGLAEDILKSNAVQNIMQDLEVQRLDALQARRSALNWILGFFAASVVLAIVLPGMIDLPEPWMSLFFPLAVAVIGAVVYFSIGSSYQENLKQTLVWHIMAEAGCSLSDGDYSFSAYNWREILPGYDRDTFGDHVHGDYKGHEFNFCEVELEERRTRVVKSGDSYRTETYYVTVFRGFLMSFDYTEKDIGADIFVRDNNNFFGLPIPHLFQSGDKVKLEDPEFSKIFEIFSSDQVKSRYFFTPMMMETFKKLHDWYPDFQAILRDNRLYFAVPTYHDYFEVSAPVNEALTEETVMTVFHDLDHITSIVKAVNS